MLARFERDVVRRESRSGAVAGRQQFRAARSAAGRGQSPRCARASSGCKASGADVVLIDPQYAPKVITKHDVDGMVDLIALDGQGSQRRSVPALRGDALLALSARTFRSAPSSRPTNCT